MDGVARRYTGLSQRICGYVVQEGASFGSDMHRLRWMESVLMKRPMLNRPRTIPNGGFTFTSFLPLALASLTVDLEVGRNTAHKTKKNVTRLMSSL
jgi:hypothetical protein